MSLLTQITLRTCSGSCISAPTALIRKLRRDSIVLLKNSTAVLPLDALRGKNAAIVGPNAKPLVLSGAQGQLLREIV